MGSVPQMLLVLFKSEVLCALRSLRNNVMLLWNLKVYLQQPNGDNILFVAIFIKTNCLRNKRFIFME